MLIKAAEPKSKESLMKKNTFTLLLLLVFSLAACAPNVIPQTGGPENEEQLDPQLQEYIRLAQEELSRQLNIPADDIRLESLQTPAEAGGAFIIRLEVNDVMYEFHGQDNTVTLVSEPLPTAPPGASDEAHLPGIIDFHSDGTAGVLTAPETVKAGEEFKVTISTFGSGCEREGDTSVVVTSTGASVMVYDFTAATSPEVVCTQELKRLNHTATLQFTEPGEMLIRVWGRRVGPDTPPVGVPTLIEHPVTVE